MARLDQQILEQLKKCSKDEASLSKLEEIYSEIMSRYEKANKHLNLLERAIIDDYDSILITELELENPGPRIVYVNDGFTKMTGYEREEVLGKTPRILQGEKTDRHVLDRLKQRLIEGQAFFGHTVNYKKDGSEFVNQWDIHPLTNAQGEITHWVSYQRDITDRQESSKMLFDANIDFEQLIEESKRTFVDLDVQGNIIASNKSFREMLGHETDELKSLKIWDLVGKDDQQQVKSLLEDFSTEQTMEDTYNWVFKKNNGEELLLEAGVRWFVSSDDTVIRIHFDNITLRNKVIDTLREKTKSLESLLSTKEEFTLKFKNHDNGSIFVAYASDSFQDIVGHPVEKVLDQGLHDVLTSDASAITKAGLDKAFLGTMSSEKIQYLDADGNEISIVQSFRPIWDADEKEVIAVRSVGLVELEV